VLKSPKIRRRVLDVLSDLCGEQPRELETDALDLAVARGASYYGLVRRGKGLTISGGAARAYYIGIDTAATVPGQLTLLRVTPRGFLEGEAVTVREHPLELVTNRPVRFRLFSSSEREGDRSGQLLTVSESALAELPPIYTVLRFARSSQQTALSVHLHARHTE